MGKKSAKLPLIYLIGVAAVVVGCFLPIVKFLGFKFSVIDAFQSLKNLDSWLALLMMASAVAGIVFCFVKMSAGKLIRLICLAASATFGLIFFARAGFFKSWFDITGPGFYVIIAGWVAGVVGRILDK